jgi:hypothetical protein
VSTRQHTILLDFDTNHVGIRGFHEP